MCRWFSNGAKIVWDLQRGSTYPLSMVRNHIKANAASQMLMSSSLVENHFEKNILATHSIHLVVSVFS